MTALSALAAVLPSAVLETILARLAPLFLAGAGSDGIAARHAAGQLLAAYHPCNEEEFFLAANIIAFSFQALEALSQAASPDLPFTRILRLRSGAVSLNREAEKARRALAQLRKTRQHAETVTVPAPETVAEPARETVAEPAREPDTAPVHPTASHAVAAKTPQATAAEADEHHERDLRIAAGLKRMDARLAANAEQSNIPAAALPAGQTQTSHGQPARPAA